MKNNNEWRKCIYCGKYISYEDFEIGEGQTHVTSDTEFTSELVESYHQKCAKIKYNK